MSWHPPLKRGAMIGRPYGTEEYGQRLIIGYAEDTQAPAGHLKPESVIIDWRLG
jgi:hypothetical protein